MAKKKMTLKQQRKVDLKAEKLLRANLRRGSLIPGRLYTFTYDAKYKHDKKKLPLWDKAPLILMLRSPFTLSSTGEEYILGLNLNHPRYRGVKLKKMFEHILETYLTIQDKVINKKDGRAIYNQKSLIDINYDKVLASDQMFQLKFGVRLYLKKHISRVKVVPIKVYDRVGTKWTAEALRARMVHNK